MIPILLHPDRARVAVIGRGALAARRVGWLRDAGARADIWSDAPSPELLAAAGGDLRFGFPGPGGFAAYHAVWIADLERPEADALARAAAEANALVNVEDVIDLCDFHTPAVVRRGKLTLAAGTGGASPAVARVVRERLEATFGAEWGQALDAVAEGRAALREQGAPANELIADARARLAQHGLG